MNALRVLMVAIVVVVAASVAVAGAIGEAGGKVTFDGVADGSPIASVGDVRFGGPQDLGFPGDVGSKVCNGPPVVQGGAAVAPACTPAAAYNIAQGYLASGTMARFASPVQAVSAKVGAVGPIGQGGVACRVEAFDSSGKQVGIDAVLVHTPGLVDTLTFKAPVGDGIAYLWLLVDGYFTPAISVTFDDLTYSSATGTTTTSTTSSGGGPEPTVDVGEPKLPDEIVPAPPAVAVDVSGDGTVVSTVAVHHAGPLRRTDATGKRGILCGTSKSLCYAQFTGRQTLAFVAKPDPGYTFANWGGACFGQGSTCTLTIGANRAISATFRPVRPSATVELDKPHVSVHWHQSVGSGQIVVTGKVSKSALLKLELRRPGGGPLLIQQQSVRAGRFSLTPQISAASLPKGTVVLPGGFVLILSGRVGSAALPQSLRTIVLPPPPDGVVRRSFTSRRLNGSPTRELPSGTKSAFVTFVFASQPAAKRKLTVEWLAPAGKAIGSTRKPNRPTVQTSISSSTALPRGTWRVRLRSGSTLIATHNVIVR
jgi:hypothetical protein